MKQSVRAKRMARNHKRNSKQTKLSLVSLMDIFTILVFFLMLNASDVQVLDNHKSVTLPESTSDKPAKETLLILVNNDAIVLQGKKVTDVDSALQDNQDTISALAKELAYHNQKRQKSAVMQQAVTAPQSDAEGQAITIMGDRSVPYAVLKKVMYTCAEAGYTDVSLAVEQLLSSEGEV